MAKMKVRYCRKCLNYTEQTYKGKPEKSQFDKDFAIVANIMSLGGYTIAEKLFDDRPKLWKCSRCGNICKSQ